jgi:hypothetical protein
MEYVFVFGIMFIIVAIISWQWVRGIDYMKKNHPDYKGDDFLNWGNEKIDDEFSRQALANQPEYIGKKPKTQSDYAREHSKPNPKQFDGVKSEEPFVKTRKRKKKNWEDEIDIGGSE